MIVNLNEIVPPNLANLPLLADVQAYEAYGTAALNRQMRGVIKKGVYAGFNLIPAAAGLKVVVSSAGGESAAAVEVGSKWIINVKQQSDVTLTVPAGRTSSIVLTAFYDGNTITDQVHAYSTTKATQLLVVNAGSEPVDSVIIGRVIVPSNATSITLAMVDLDKRDRVSLEGFWNKLDADNIAPKSQWIRTYLNRGIKPSLDNVRAAAVDSLGATSAWFKDSWVNSYRGGSIDIEGTIRAGGRLAMLQGDFGIGGTSVVLAEGTDLNALAQENSNFRGVKLLNTPEGAGQSAGWWFIEHITHSPEHVFQRATKYAATGHYGVWFRTKLSGVWQAWDNVYSVNNKPTKTDVGLSLVANERQYSAQNTNIGTGALNYAAGNHNHDTVYSNLGHKHLWADITNPPAQATRWPTLAEIGAQAAGDYAAASHSHPWSQITGAPAFATRWPTLAEIGAQPAGSYAAASHTHPWAQVTGAPVYTTRWPAWAEVTGKPDTFEFVKTLSTESLDTVIDTGWYHNPSDSQATSVKNYPYLQAGRLEVYASGSMIFQNYTTYSLGVVYARCRYNGVWNDWKKQYSENAKPSLSELGAAAASHAHTWSQITGAPVYTTRWPTWDEIPSKPVQATRWPTLAEIGAQAAGDYAGASHTHPWANITGAPVYTTRWPTWDEIPSKPVQATRWPTLAEIGAQAAGSYAAASHTHPWANITGAPVYTTRWPTAAEAGALAVNATAKDSEKLGGDLAKYFPLNNERRILNPVGASFANTTSKLTGALKITLPQSWTSTMMRMRVKIYEYDSNGAYDLILSGYNYVASSMWANVSAQAGSDLPSGRDGLKVRFGHDGTKCCIWIGEVSDVWNYVQCFISEFEHGFSDTVTDRWIGGWDIGVANSFVGKVDITNSVYKPYSSGNKPTPAEIGAQAAGSYAAASHTHPWANITGVPVYTTRWPTLAEIGAQAAGSYAAASHTHPWANITGAPVYTTRWPTWDEIPSKPVQATRWPTLAEIGAQAAGSYAAASHTHPWANITGAPVYTTRWPTLAEIGAQPAGSYAAASHTHPWANITGAPVYTTRWPTLAEIGAANQNGLRDQFVSFEVGGDANTYYPVLISKGQSTFGMDEISISRGYSAKAPDTWNTPTHKGGLTLSLRYSGDASWGGNDHLVRVIHFSEQYTTVACGLHLSSSGLIVWLRGGGAIYNLQTINGNAASVSVYLTDLKAGDNAIYSPRAYSAALVAQQIYSRMTVRGYDLYDNNNRVYSDINKPTPSDLGAAAASHSHPWSQITGAPVYTTRWPTLAEIGAQAAGSYAAASHTHPWANITGAPVYTTRWPTLAEIGAQAAGSYAAASHTHAWSQITGVPVQATRWPNASEVGLGNVPNTVHSANADINTVTVRDAAGDINARLFRSNYQFEASMGGGLAFRNSTTDNYIRFCSNPDAVRSWVGAAAASHTHSWAQVTGAPVYTTRWPTWGEVSGKPSTMPPDPHGHGEIDYMDTRGTNYNPNTVPSKLRMTFQQGGTNGVSDGGTYYSLLHLPRYSDPSGGYGNQIAFTDNGNMWMRQGISTTAWGGWAKIYTSLAKPTLAELGAQAAGSYAAASHTHPWSQITGIPVQATRWPNATEVGLGNVPNTVHSAAEAANTVAVRDGSADLVARTLRSSLGNESSISGAIAFRTEGGNNNYLRFCSSPDAVRSWVGAAAASHTHSWAQVTGAPVYTTRWPTWNEVSSKPVYATRWPTWEEIGGKPPIVNEWIDIHNSVGTYVATVDLPQALLNHLIAGESAYIRVSFNRSGSIHSQRHTVEQYLNGNDGWRGTAGQVIVDMTWTSVSYCNVRNAHANNAVSERNKIISQYSNIARVSYKLV